jgi:hypothetical protein
MNEPGDITACPCRAIARGRLYGPEAQFAKSEWLARLAPDAILRVPANSSTTFMAGPKASSVFPELENVLRLVRAEKPAKKTHGRTPDSEDISPRSMLSRLVCNDSEAPHRTAKA